ncbi:MAG: hypothetical protein D6741_17025, partial [Planctomycetota bacterium]
MLPEGQIVTARLRGIDDQGRFRFEAGTQTLLLGTDQFIRFGSVPVVSRGPVVVLRSGGMVCGDVVHADDSTVVVLSDLFGVQRLDRDGVAGILFALPGDVGRLDRELDRCGLLPGVKTETDHDIVWLANGDEIQGRIRGATDRRLQIETELGEIEPARNQLQGVRFADGRSSGAEPVCAVGFRDGSVLPAVRVAAGKEEEIVLQDTRGRMWQASTSRVRFVQAFSDRWVYLSDSQVEYRHVPFFSVVLPDRKDRNVAEGRLRAGGTTYWKGIGVYSASRLSCR